MLMGRKTISGHVAYSALYVCCFCVRVYASSKVTMSFQFNFIFTSGFQFGLFVMTENCKDGFWYFA